MDSAAGSSFAGRRHSAPLEDDDSGDVVSSAGGVDSADGEVDSAGGVLSADDSAGGGEAEAGVVVPPPPTVTTTVPPEEGAPALPFEGVAPSRSTADCGLASVPSPSGAVDPAASSVVGSVTPSSAG